MAQISNYVSTAVGASRSDFNPSAYGGYGSSRMCQLAVDKGAYEGPYSSESNVELPSVWGSGLLGSALQEVGSWFDKSSDGLQLSSSASQYKTPSSGSSYHGQSDDLASSCSNQDDAYSFGSNPDSSDCSNTGSPAGRQGGLSQESMDGLCKLIPWEIDCPQFK